MAVQVISMLMPTPKYLQHLPANQGQASAKAIPE